MSNIRWIHRKDKDNEKRVISLNEIKERYLVDNSKDHNLKKNKNTCEKKKCNIKFYEKKKNGKPQQQVIFQNGYPKKNVNIILNNKNHELYYKTKIQEKNERNCNSEMFKKINGRNNIQENYRNYLCHNNNKRDYISNKELDTDKVNINLDITVQWDKKCNNNISCIKKKDLITNDFHLDDSLIMYEQNEGNKYIKSNYYDEPVNSSIFNYDNKGDLDYNNTYKYYYDDKKMEYNMEEEDKIRNPYIYNNNNNKYNKYVRKEDHKSCSEQSLKDNNEMIENMKKNNFNNKKYKNVLYNNAGEENNINPFIKNNPFTINRIEDVLKKNNKNNLNISSNKASYTNNKNMHTQCYNYNNMYNEIKRGPNIFILNYEYKEKLISFSSLLNKILQEKICDYFVIVIKIYLLQKRHKPIYKKYNKVKEQSNDIFINEDNHMYIKKTNNKNNDSKIKRTLQGNVHKKRSSNENCTNKIIDKFTHFEMEKNTYKKTVLNNTLIDSFNDVDINDQKRKKKYLNFFVILLSLFLKKYLYKQMSKFFFIVGSLRQKYEEKRQIRKYINIKIYALSLLERIFYRKEKENLKLCFVRFKKTNRCIIIKEKNNEEDNLQSTFFTENIKSNIIKSRKYLENKCFGKPKLYKTDDFIIFLNRKLLKEKDEIFQKCLLRSKSDSLLDFLKMSKLKKTWRSSSNNFSDTMNDNMRGSTLLEHFFTATYNINNNSFHNEINKSRMNISYYENKHVSSNFLTNNNEYNNNTKENTKGNSNIKINDKNLKMKQNNISNEKISNTFQQNVKGNQNLLKNFFLDEYKEKKKSIDEHINDKNCRIFFKNIKKQLKINYKEKVDVHKKNYNEDLTLSDLNSTMGFSKNINSYIYDDTQRNFQEDLVPNLNFLTQSDLNIINNLTQNFTK
ncbi:hypothetical protein PFTANZ_01035 [Plasmodium falciparum Tanzania (2000708)]|uniref:Uncharacterized protein n=1 Tax=Plasmodium falciparum Tanzania (2000708) TaxID=1036725 RepID=A0A024WCJ4_PLAFA|nr:hypothetical protein PFTANZ_01035 [Plasmodium falciparum Tanzania (2000708)]